MSGRGRRMVACCALGLLAAVTAACRADARVKVDVEADGSGTVAVRVQLDQSATAALGDEVDRLQLADLADAGWTVEVPTATADGLRIEATKPFTRPDDLPAVLAEVVGSGDQQVFRDWRLRVDDELAATRYAVDGRVVATGDLSELSDGAVAAALDGLATGRTADELAALLGEEGSGVRLRVEVALPGSAAVADEVDLIGDGPVERAISASSTVSSRRTQLLAALTIVALGGGAMAMLTGRRGRRRRGPVGEE